MINLNVPKFVKCEEDNLEEIEKKLNILKEELEYSLRSIACVKGKGKSKLKKEKEQTMEDQPDINEGVIMVRRKRHDVLADGGVLPLGVYSRRIVPSRFEKNAVDIFNAEGDIICRISAHDLSEALERFKAISKALQIVKADEALKAVFSQAIKGGEATLETAWGQVWKQK